MYIALLAGFVAAFVISNIGIYIFRFRSYLVTDVGRILNAKGGLMNFHEA